KDVIKNFDLFGMAPKMFNCFERYVSPDMRVLDVGTGRGVATRFLVSKIREAPEKGGEVYSIDLSDELQKLVSEIMEGEGLGKFVKFQIASVENLPFSDSYFDFILTMNSFHHFLNPIEALGEMKRVLKRNGIICIVDWSKKARFVPHKKEDLYNIEDFKKLIDNINIIDEYSEKLWWFVAIKK
ncbi:MAG: class I SAM-dependent methyltransferase, partial [Candidatus Helarchaeota archaeon]